MTTAKVETAIQKRFSEITHAEWICYHWIDVTTIGDAGSKYIRGTKRPLDEAMRLSGGSIETLQPYLWALDKTD